MSGLNFARRKGRTQLREKSFNPDFRGRENNQSSDDCRGQR
jgi:hypothetical protein